MENNTDLDKASYLMGYVDGKSHRKSIFKETCKLRPTKDCENDKYYLTSCTQASYSMEGDIKHNSYMYCPYCGKEIEETK